MDGHDALSRVVFSWLYSLLFIKHLDGVLVPSSSTPVEELQAVLESSLDVPLASGLGRPEQMNITVVRFLSVATFLSQLFWQGSRVMVKLSSKKVSKELCHSLSSRKVESQFSCSSFVIRVNLLHPCSFMVYY